METVFEGLDWFVLGIYFFLLIGVAVWVVIQKNKNTEDYFLAIEETINKTTINKWQKGDLINLERAMKIGDRLDGHMIQGHVDQIGECIKSEIKDGSWEYTIEYKKSENITVEKGSIAINGVSLTVIDSMPNSFKVAIIPYTFEHTNFHQLEVGHTVNLEFDIIGKYVAKIMR